MHYRLIDICIVSAVLIFNTQAYTSISSPIPIRGGSVTIFCSASSTVTFYNTQIQSSSLAICNLPIPNSCTPSSFSPNGQTIYQFVTNSTTSWVNILSLNRGRDQTIWRCEYGIGFIPETINLTVYTPPSAVIYPSLPPSTDLSQTSLILECRTDRCIYPEPQITWYFQNGYSYFNSSSATVTSDNSTCDQSEKIYTSTLRILSNTVFPGNVPTTTKLKCGVLHSAINGQLFTQPSNDVIFAVSLTYINISGPTNVTNGTQVNFTCTTSVSRPLSSVNWRIGNMTVAGENFNRTTSDNMTYVESRLMFVVNDVLHHDKEINCEAYTILATTVRSESRRLYVRVPVQRVSLSPANSTITDMEGSEKSFECITSEGRPQPVVRWWTGSTQLLNVSRDEAMINGTRVSLRSVLYIRMNRSHHNKILFCDAFVTDQPIVVESSKSVFNVLYPPTIPMVRPFKNVFPWFENRTEYLECFTSDGGNPSSSVIWNTTRGAVAANQQLVINNLAANDNGLRILCQLQNSYTMVMNITLISEAIQLNVEYTPIITLSPPNTSVIVNETNELNLSCSATGNPKPNSITWLYKNYSSTSLYISNIRRNSTGIYTCAAQSISNSNITLRMTKQVTVTVQYAPDISVVVNLMQSERSIAVVCHAQGVPSTYSFNSWVHMFGNVVVRSGLHGTVANSTSILNIYNASLEDMGTYVCTATNGIIGLNGNLSQSNRTNLNVKGSPRLFTEYQYVNGEVGQSLNISIQFYSYPFLSNITIKRNGVLINSSDRITWSSALYNFTMYNKTVQLKIQVVHFIISALKKDGFGEYTLDFTNELGTTEFLVELKAPEATGDISVGPVVGGVVGSVTSLTAVAIIVFVLKRRGFNLNPRKVISDIHSKLTKINFCHNSKENTETEYDNNVPNCTDEEITYEDLRKRTSSRSSDSPYMGFQVENSSDQYFRSSAVYANQPRQSYANVEVHTYENIGHINYNENIYQNTST